MRMFIALCFARQVRREIRDVQKRLGALARRGALTPEENLHLTLAFLGEVPEARLGAVQEAMEAVDMVPLTLTFDRLGRFSQREGALWWLGAAPDPALETVQAALARQLRQRGFLLEERAFKPHLTLGRRMELPEAPDREAVLGAPITAHAEQMTLMRSQRGERGMCYTPLYRR